MHQFSCVAKLEHNLVVERKHQHILNVARALYFQFRVLHFWSECILIVVYLINCTPSDVLQWQTSFVLLNCSLLDYSLMRVFGFLCFASTTPSLRSKFPPHAIPVVFVGYPSGMKTYKLFDIEKCKFFFLIWGDVVFHDTVFPFHKVTLCFLKYHKVTLSNNQFDIFLKHCPPTVSWHWHTITHHTI